MYAGYVKWNDGSMTDLEFRQFIDGEGKPLKLLSPGNELLLHEGEKILWKSNEITSDIYIWGKGSRLNTDLFMKAQSHIILTNKRIIIIRQPGIEYIGSYGAPMHERRRIEKANAANTQGMKLFINLFLNAVKIHIYWNDVFCEFHNIDNTLVKIVFDPQDMAQVHFAPYLTNRNKMRKKNLAEAKRFWKEIKHGGQVGED